MGRDYKLINNLSDLYLLYHIVFLMLWLFRVLNAKWLWWVHWIPIVIMIAAFFFNDELAEQAKISNRDSSRRMILTVWMCIAVISSILHSAW